MRSEEMVQILYEEAKQIRLEMAKKETELNIKIDRIKAAIFRMTLAVLCLLVGVISYLLTNGLPWRN